MNGNNESISYLSDIVSQNPYRDYLEYIAQVRYGVDFTILGIYCLPLSVLWREICFCSHQLLVLTTFHYRPELLE